MAQEFSIARFEKRIPMTVAVHISGPEGASQVEMTFTEDVSSRGARVSSVRRWRTNETINFESLPGGFRALARVAYCQPHREGCALQGIILSHDVAFTSVGCVGRIPALHGPFHDVFHV